MRGGGGLESEVERAQAKLFEAKKELQAEHEELARVKQSLAAGKAQLEEMKRMAEAQAAASGGDDGEMARKLAEMEESMKAMDEVAESRPPPPVQQGISQEDFDRALITFGEEAKKRVEQAEDALRDEHTIEMEDAEELRMVCVAVLTQELEEVEMSGGRGLAALAADSEAKGAALLAAANEEAQQELRALKSSLAAALDAKSQLEAELKDALAAVRGAGGGASELLDAKKEVTRLKRAIA